VSNINLYNFTRRVPCGVSLSHIHPFSHTSTFELIPAVATAQPGALVTVQRLRKCSDLIREGKVFVKNKTRVASGVGCSERAVLYFIELLFKSIKKTYSFRRVESEKIGSQFGDIQPQIMACF